MGFRHSLAGTNGIPREGERLYLRVMAECAEDGRVRVDQVLWPDGRRFPVASTTHVRTLGRWDMGNLVEEYEISLKRRGRPEARRTVWWERGRWFVARDEGGARGEGPRHKGYD